MAVTILTGRQGLHRRADPINVVGRMVLTENAPYVVFSDIVADSSGEILNVSTASPSISAVRPDLSRQKYKKVCE